MRVLLIVLSFASLVHAADQTILGKQLLVKDPQPGVDATKRRIVGQGLEAGSPNTIVGDPTATGATLTVFADGTTASSETYQLPAALWTTVKGGFKYKDGQLTMGPVKTAVITLANGTFRLRAVVVGKTSGISLLPPNVGTEGCALFEITGGDRYHVRFPPAPDSTIKKDDAQAFVIKDATVEGVCPQACAPGASGCGWNVGDVFTWAQADWGDDPNGSNIATTLYDKFATVYAATGAILIVGALTPGFGMAFNSPLYLTPYLPDVGTPGPLTANLFNPASTMSHSFGGEVVALKLNIDFADAHLFGATAPIALGDLELSSVDWRFLTERPSASCSPSRTRCLVA
jgi:hypothetical protein